MDAPSAKRATELVALCRELLADRHLIVAFNRPPVEHSLDPDGQLRARRGVGGVVTAVGALSQFVELTWIASPMSEGDRLAATRAAAQRLESPLEGQQLNLRYVVEPRSVYHKHYNVFCNPLLWFLQHGLWNAPYTPNITAATYDAWERGYVVVNRAFADAIVDEAARHAGAPVVMLHDYHLYLVARHVRERMPAALIQHFVHIPWPAPQAWSMLPGFMREAIFESLCANDIVGFQTRESVADFITCVETFLPEASVDHERGNLHGTVHLAGHETQVFAYPISVDVDDLAIVAESDSVKEIEERLLPLFGEQTIVRVDRAEPSKNVLRGFRAYDALLQRFPEHRGRVRFLAFLVPSRTSLRQYQRYRDEVLGAVDAINGKYGTEAWQPVQVFYEHNYPQAIAALRHSDVLLVNAVADGMNLVAKEGAVVNTRDGVLILSETAGAHDELGEAALSVSPMDVEGTALALQQALTMDPAERRRRAQTLRAIVVERDVAAWFRRQVDDLLVLARQRGLPNPS